ncbi:hypothetical protein [Nonomuraea jabiensis]|uniref:hypothetical protein n=1 Tax=Nonomuraea jabiensis TaxID=882448 RepID=UPI003D7327A6
MLWIIVTSAPALLPRVELLDKGHALPSLLDDALQRGKRDLSRRKTDGLQVIDTTPVAAVPA